MEFTTVYARTDTKVSIEVASGHFATNHSHISQYVDLTGIKSRHLMARRAAAILAGDYNHTPVDAIVCLEGTNMLGAFIAEELAQSGHMSMNSGADICVLTPELNANNQMIFLPNTQGMVRNKHVMLLLASVSTGKTITRAMDCLSYYEAKINAVCAVFSAADAHDGIRISSVFTEKDLPEYRTYIPHQCEMCARHERLDAIVNSFGFSPL